MVLRTGKVMMKTASFVVLIERHGAWQAGSPYLRNASCSRVREAQAIARNEWYLSIG